MRGSHGNGHVLDNRGHSQSFSYLFGDQSITLTCQISEHQGLVARSCWFQCEAMTPKQAYAVAHALLSSDAFKPSQPLLLSYLIPKLLITSPMI